MKIFLSLILMSSVAWSAEVKVFLDKQSVFTGEVISASVENYTGPEIIEKKISDELYILRLKENEAQLIFLKKPAVNLLPLNEEDHIIWNPVEVIEVGEAKSIVLSPQEFIIKNYYWILYLLVALVALITISLVYIKKIKPRSIIKKERRSIKEKIFTAKSVEEISSIWKEKYYYIEVFPFIEEEFNKFEVVFYKLAFKPNLSNDEKKEIERKYRDFLDSVQGGNFGI